MEDAIQVLIQRWNYHSAFPLKGALNPNFLNLTITREKLWL